MSNGTGVSSVCRVEAPFQLACPTVTNISYSAVSVGPSAVSLSSSSAVISPPPTFTIDLKMRALKQEVRSPPTTTSVDIGVISIPSSHGGKPWQFRAKLWVYRDRAGNPLDNPPPYISYDISENGDVTTEVFLNEWVCQIVFASDADYESHGKSLPPDLSEKFTIGTLIPDPNESGKKLLKYDQIKFC
jgi:hypothetical protein